jgi:hypothetical protein
MYLGQLKLKEIDLFEKMDWSRDTLFCYNRTIQGKNVT